MEMVMGRFLGDGNAVHAMTLVETTGWLEPQDHVLLHDNQNWLGR
jgi:hypothetical protein